MNFWFFDENKYVTFINVTLLDDDSNENQSNGANDEMKFFIEHFSLSMVIAIITR